jgi:hypothetical protein
MIGVNFVFIIVYNFAHKKEDATAAAAQITSNLSFAVRKAAETLDGDAHPNLKLV